MRTPWGRHVVYYVCPANEPWYYEDETGVHFRSGGKFYFRRKAAFRHARGLSGAYVLKESLDHPQRVAKIWQV